MALRRIIIIFAVTILLIPSSVAASDAQIATESNDPALVLSTEDEVVSDFTPNPEVIDNEPSDSEDETAPDDDESASSQDFSHLLITKIKIGPGNDEYIELFNNSGAQISMNGIVIQALSRNTTADGTGGKKSILKVFGDEIIEPYEFYVLANQDFTISDQVVFNEMFDDEFEKKYSARNGGLATNGAVRLVSISDAGAEEVLQVLSWNKSIIQPSVNIEDGSYRCSESMDIFSVENNFWISGEVQMRTIPTCAVDDAEEADNEEAPGDSAGEADEQDETQVQTDSCDSLIINEILANAPNDEQFIEIKNSSEKVVDISKCKLMTNRLGVKMYNFDSLKLSPGDMRSIQVSDTDLKLSKTVSGTVYILDSLDREVAETTYDKLPPGTSWSLVDDEWLITYEVTPDAENVYKKWPPCEEGYWRNEQTGRCNKKIEQTIPAPCSVGQYRSADTGRCRSVAVTTASLKPCSVGQYRNPTTGRCKKNASETGALKPCDDGYERNEETNRCRKVLASIAPIAPFAPEKVVKNSQSLVGWWAIGGLTILAVAYAGWQWRFEMSQAIKKVRQAFSSRDKSG